MKLKKIVAFLLSAVLLLPAFTVAVGARSSVFKVEVTAESPASGLLYTAGEEVKVTVRAVQNTGVDYLKLKISYDPAALEYVDYVNNQAFGTGSTESFLPKNGYLIYTAFCGEIATQTGDMFTLTFKVKDGFCGNVEVAVGLSGNNVNNCMITAPSKKEVVPFIGGFAALVVDHTYESVVTAPDCVNGGYTTYTCVICGSSYVADEIDALGHTYESVVTAPDCVNGGYTTYTCSVCGDTYVADEIDALGHTYEAVVTAPDCVNGGYTTYTCSVCGDTYVADETDALGHTYDNACDANCNVCDAAREVPDHVYDNDCDVDCNVCGAVREVPDHVYESVVTAPDCVNGGYTTYTCSICGDTYVADETDALGHTYEAVVTAPDCVNGGYTTYTCSVCGDTYVADETDALGHTYDNDCDANCNVCDDVREVGEHVYDDEYDADCNVCGAIREVPEKPFTPGDANGDGAINNRDVALLQQYINKWDVTLNMDAADANGDGAVNNRDLALLQQYINKWDVTLG